MKTNKPRWRPSSQKRKKEEMVKPEYQRVGKRMQQILYFAGMAVLGGILWAVGQSWAVGILAGGCAGVVFFGVGAALNHHRSI
jgi:hypothetical protein